MILVQRILFLKNVPLFSTMPPDTLAWVAVAADDEPDRRGNFRCWFAATGAASL